MTNNKNKNNNNNKTTAKKIRADFCFAISDVFFLGTQSSKTQTTKTCKKYKLNTAKLLKHTTQKQNKKTHRNNNKQQNNNTNSTKKTNKKTSSSEPVGSFLSRQPMSLM